MKDNKKTKIIYVFIYISLTMIMFGLLSFAYRHIMNSRQESLIEQIINIGDIEVNDRTALVRDAMKQNEDTVAWLEVPNTNINMPVVRAENNEFYLYHNFQKRRDSAGWAFADFRNSFPDLNRNTIVFGHTFTGSRVVFTDLNRMLNEDWFEKEENHYLYLATEQNEYKYRIFAVYTIAPVTDYMQISFRSNFEYEDFLNMLKNRSIQEFETTINRRLPILTLSTCTRGVNRLVVHAILQTS